MLAVLMQVAAAGHPAAHPTGAAGATPRRLAAGGAGSPLAQQPGEKPRFRTGVAVVNVTATVTDGSGRFVSGLRKEDFALYEDGQAREITLFASERVPVSLGIVLDTSGSMAGDKLTRAKHAINRFLTDLLDPSDEIFLCTFNDRPAVIEEWTTDRRVLSAAVRAIAARGGTAMYDAIAEALPIAQNGRHRKKALVVISDGNDTSSLTEAEDLKPLIRESEVLVYAIAIDGTARATFVPPRRPPFPFPPIPGRRNPWPIPIPPPGTGGRSTVSGAERANVRALRLITDESGGRTETIREAEDLGPATASVADELSRQYLLGYQSGADRDGRWHSIEVRVNNPRLRVRARRGFVSS